MDVRNERRGGVARCEQHTDGGCIGGLLIVLVGVWEAAADDAEHDERLRHVGWKVGHRRVDNCHDAVKASKVLGLGRIAEQTRGGAVGGEVASDRVIAGAAERQACGCVDDGPGCSGRLRLEHIEQWPAGAVGMIYVLSRPLHEDLCLAEVRRCRDVGRPAQWHLQWDKSAQINRARHGGVHGDVQQVELAWAAGLEEGDRLAVAVVEVNGDVDSDAAVRLDHPILHVDEQVVAVGLEAGLRGDLHEELLQAVNEGLTRRGGRARSDDGDEHVAAEDGLAHGKDVGSATDVGIAHGAGAKKVELAQAVVADGSRARRGQAGVGDGQARVEEDGARAPRQRQLAAIISVQHVLWKIKMNDARSGRGKKNGEDRRDDLRRHDVANNSCPVPHCRTQGTNATRSTRVRSELAEL